MCLSLPTEISPQNCQIMYDHTSSLGGSRLDLVLTAKESSLERENSTFIIMQKPDTHTTLTN